MINLIKSSDESAHQTVTEFIKLQTPHETIQIGFTDQKVSGRAGLLTFAGFLHWHRFGKLLARVLPRFKQRRRGYQPFEYGLGFLAGILAGAKKLTHVAHLRSDVMLAPLLAIAGIASQSAFSRFFQRFTSDLLNSLPSFLRLRVVRADSGFCLPEWLALLEGLALRYIVVARLLQPLQRLLRQDLIWEASEVPGTDVAQVWHQEINWPQPRRVILVRHRAAEKERPCGKKLIDCPGYLYQALVTNLPESVRPIAVWREYNGRAGCEEVIKQLDADFGLPQLCLEKFWSTEAALSLAVLSYNLCVLFQRRLGWLDRVTAATLRFRLFTTGGIISQTAGRTTIRLSVPEPERAWWREVLAKVRGEFPKCNAVSQTPG